MRREIAESLEKNRHEMEERLQLTKNFDLVERKLKVGDRDACLYFVDGFVKDEVLEKLMEFFQSLRSRNFCWKMARLSAGFLSPMWRWTF